MLHTLVNRNAPVTKTKGQDLANEDLQDFGHIFFGELIIPSPKLWDQKHHNLHFNNSREKRDKLVSHILLTSTFGVHNLTAVERCHRASESCYNIV